MLQLDETTSIVADDVSILYHLCIVASPNAKFISMLNERACPHMLMHMHIETSSFWCGSGYRKEKLSGPKLFVCGSSARKKPLVERHLKSWLNRTLFKIRPENSGIQYIHEGANLKFYIPDFFNFKLLIPEYSPI
jgi:hypothetical protein